MGWGLDVWTTDMDKASEIAQAEQLKLGTIWINQGRVAFGPNIPLPRQQKPLVLVPEWGREGLLEFTGMKVVNINLSLHR